jgi:RNA polymerase sigma factor (sigma-70 family)
MERSDEELLSACRQGDESAWEALVMRYQRLLYAIPRRAGLDEDVAAEVFQDVFAALLEKLDAIERPERLQAWLVTTAKRKTWRAITREQRFARGDEAEAGEELDELPDNAPLPEETLVQLEEQHRVRQALARLDERCRTLLARLFYAEELPSYSDIAAELGIPEGSVGPTRARCLRKLLQQLDKL